MSGAFFSYSRIDSEFALRLGEDLRAAGLNVWVDQLDIEAGAEWDIAIENALTRCHQMLVILSPSSVASRMVRNEVLFAFEENKVVIPILHKPCDVPLNLRRIQHIDFKTDYDRALQSLIKRLRTAAAADGGAGQTIAAREVTSTHNDPAPEVVPDIQKSVVPEAEAVRKVAKESPAIASKFSSTPGRYAIFTTTKGQFVCRLFEQDVPMTVKNFIELAQGHREWTHPGTGLKSKDRLYDGTSFHRVIPEFMIQGGDPVGTGMGGPGYKFADEPDKSGRNFKSAGRLAMANAGPNTNGSQFFITVAPTAWLNGKHTIFGEVIEGMEVVDAISKVRRNSLDMPLEPVLIESLDIKTIP
jgi:peptidyl-prolyl cis-trans isomerase A (cyclophilin A)